MKNKKHIAILIILLTVITLAVLLIFFSKPHFESTKWKGSWVQFKLNEKKLDGTELYSYLSSREKMTKDLIKNKTLIGLTKQGVVDLLGLEDNKLDSDRWLYWLAFTASDNKWLVVEFGDAGVVTGNYIYED